MPTLNLFIGKGIDSPNNVAVDNCFCQNNFLAVVWQLGCTLTYTSQKHA